MADIDRDLRRLAQRYRITFKSISNSQQWPSAHQNSFQSVRRIGDQKFDKFCANIDIRSNDEPWREQTKHRAKWLAKRAAQLFNQQRNEAGWRFGLENDVLRRFSVEVACPKCRARIWRSEVEACINQSDDVAGSLEERQKNRKPCTCPPKDRPQDYYEMGTNPLFDDRTQEVIIHDPLLRSQLPKQEPDRVYGLQMTNNFERLFSTPLPSTISNDPDVTLGEIVRSCPFKDGVEPLLFPFLILEAKSEKSSNGFNDIQAQTAFPIFALLKLQEDLFAQAADGHRADRPLIWFFANRGDAWRVYGCCVSDDEPTGYNIFQLWDGSIMSEDKSLQLLLIVDYIFDWARDVYRPSILRQLKSIVTGSPFDQISLTDDSDIVSMRRNISNWIQAPPSTAAALEFEQDLREPNILPLPDHQSLLPLPIPNTKLGTLHSAALVESRIEGLYITEQNVRTLRQLGGEQSARKLLNFLSKWDELFLLTGDDLDDLEETWTGRLRTADEASASSTYSKFYVLIEMRMFMNTSWTIVREITYLAVSEAAFEIIVNNANFRIQHPGIKLVPKAGRPCSKKILTDTLKCLISGSPAQLFIAAVACTCLSLYSLPERKRSDYDPPIKALGFGHIRQSRLSLFIKKFHKISKRKEEETPFVVPTAVFALPPKQQRNWVKKHYREDRAPEPKDLSFIRVSERIGRASERDYHEETLCERCLHGHKYEEKQHHLTVSSHDVFSAYGLNLVVSLNLIGNGVDRNDICLFAIDTIPELTDNVGLAVIVEDILQSGYVHHTIRHPIQYQVDPDDTISNIPLPYRPVTDKERMDVADWVKELKGYPISVPTEQKSQEYRWDSLQLLLHFLGKGKTWAIANQEVNFKFKKKSEKRIRDEVYQESAREEVKRRRAEAGESIKLRPIIQCGPLPETTRGDLPMPYYH